MRRRTESDYEKLEKHAEAQQQLLHCLDDACGWTGPRAAAEGDGCPNCGKEAEADETHRLGACACKSCQPLRLR